ncbi:MAG: hypothetical protein CSA62_14275 [Planctomycetota bacterium]|nr:MAG: hypothetical protein CSA62_14275 [Planctomycetota bacterium]
MVSLQPSALVAAFLLASYAGASSSGLILKPYGPATAGKGNISPELWVRGHPSPGQSSFRFEVSKGLGAGPAFMVGGFRQTKLSVLGLSLLVDPMTPGFFLPWSGVLGGGAGQAGAGSVSIAFPLPNMPSIAGVSLYTQVFVLDAAAPGGLSASKGLRSTFNRGPLAVLCGHRSLRSYDYGRQKAVNDGTRSSPDDVQFNRAGTLLFATGRDSGSAGVFEIYDATVSPLKKLKMVSLGPGLPNHLVVHPSDTRAYVAIADKPGKAGYVRIVDIDRSSSTFGTVLGQVKNIPAGLRFFEGGSVSANGRVLCIAEFQFSGASSLHVIDVDPSSSTRDTWKKTILLPGVGSMLTDVDVDADGLYAYVCAVSFGGPPTFAQVLLPTGRVTKLVSISNNVRFPTDIDLDPRGRFLVVSCSNSSNLVYFPLTRGPSFMVPRLMQSAGKAKPFSVALTPDSRLAIAATMSHGFVAWDVATGKIVWRNQSVSGGDGIAVR